MSEYSSRPASAFSSSTGSHSMENVGFVMPRFSASQPTAPLADLTQYINPAVNNSRVQKAIGNHIQGYQKKNPSRPDTYKTVMCQAWLEDRVCSFGENCKFAHGEQELRPVRTQQRTNHKYKTKWCDKYTTSGICPYGSRCLFIHPAPPATARSPPSAYAAPGWTQFAVPTVDFENSCMALVAAPQQNPLALKMAAHCQGPMADGPLDTSLQMNEAAESMLSFLWA